VSMAPGAFSVRVEEIPMNSAISDANSPTTFS
jgi:hypothetical protein